MISPISTIRRLKEVLSQEALNQLDEKHGNFSRFSKF